MALDIATIVLFMGALVFIAHFFEWLFSLTKIPNALLLMILGLILGPLAGVITPEFFGQAGQLGVTIALIILLFGGGLELRLGMLKQAWRGTLVLTLISFVLSAGAVGAFVWWLTELPLLLAIAVGVMVGGTASAVVDSVVENVRISKAGGTMLWLESALTDVLSVVVTIGILQAIAAGSFSVPVIALQTAWSFTVPAVAGLAAGIAWSLLLNKIRHMRNSIFSTPAFVFILYGLMETIGVSGLVAALAFGVTLGNIGWLRGRLHSEHKLLNFLVDPQALSRRERVFFSEIGFLLQTFFFVFAGMSITLATPWVIVFGLLLTLVMFVLRHPAVQIAVPKVTPVTDASVMAVMIPKGLATAVLAALPLQMGLAGGEFVQNLVYPIILFSVVLTSLAIFFTQRTGLGALHRRMFAGFGHYMEAPVESPDARITGS